VADYLVTGAAGFIASRVAEMLLEEGHRVFGVDNMNDAYDVRIKEFRLQQLLDHDNFTFKKMDIADRDAVAGLAGEIGTPEAVFNLAARAGVRDSVEDPWTYVHTNYIGTLNLLEFCRHQSVSKFILSSSSSVYGAKAVPPATEENDTSHPLQPYASSKKSAETICHAYHFLHEIDITIFRYFSVYGPKGRPDMVLFRFIKWIVEGETLQLNGDGSQKRGFTYVDDIARGTILGLKLAGYEIINLGGHEIISLNELIEMIEEYVGKKAKIKKHPLPKADIMASWADVKKAKEVLGWEPQVNLQEGVPRMIEWYLENREFASQIKI